MKGLRTLFGLIALFTSFVLLGMYLIVYVEFILNLYGGSIGDLPYEVTPTLLIVPPALFVTAILAMATRRSKVGAIITSLFFLASAGVGLYFEWLYYFPNPGVAFFMYFFAGVGLFFLLGGIFQRKKYRTKSEERAYKQQLSMQNGPYASPAPGYAPQGAYQQPVYQQPYPQPTYQQAPAAPLYQAPANGWVCPSCGNVNDPNGRFCRTCGGSRPAGYHSAPIPPMPVQPAPIQPAPVQVAPQPVQPAPVQPTPVVPTPVVPEPVMPTPVEPTQEPIIPEVIQEVPAESSSLLGSPEPLLSEPAPVSEPTPLMETPKAPEKVEENKPADTWECKVCKTKNPLKSKFCKNCGSPKEAN